MSHADDIAPLFIFSLPRSGSTLAQRVIASHPEVATTSEPWFLLPAMYAVNEDGLRAEYWHVVASRAVRSFCDQLPAGRADYDDAVRGFALDLYRRAAGEDAQYFLDKTPRYHLIVDRVLSAFPSAKVIFLWRNPLAVVGSMMETFRGGRWEPDRFEVDLLDGVERLTAALSAAGDRAISVRFEDLVRGEDEWRRVFNHLGLAFEPAFLDSFEQVELPGIGIKRYPRVSREPLAKWQSTLAGVVRKRWASRYLTWIGEERLEVMGYSIEELVDAVNGLPVRPMRTIPDGWTAMRSRLYAARLARSIWWHEGPEAVGPEYR